MRETIARIDFDCLFVPFGRSINLTFIFTENAKVIVGNVVFGIEFYALEIVVLSFLIVSHLVIRNAD